ncbi:uncharacterized protein BXIN_1851 [Babesia sp. Xinjiang]|uniref:uncharacterized protein n=1 Tax=Babesia sp. Xinjiang TaxID=462227 RepID=UPI000A23314B|nr:uncharacterized protein BXIN_1851 [Babesia sp. Xinjiang]ORM40435.1 hypothetical protein BXIN_1851 [Babesia sp. Xinjiang]
MASFSRGREQMSGVETTTDSEHSSKRHASIPWPRPNEPVMFHDDQVNNPSRFPPNLWLGSTPQMGMIPPGMGMVPPFSPVMMPMPLNGEEARAFQAAMMGTSAYSPFPGAAATPSNRNDDKHDPTDSSFQVLGQHPAIGSNFKDRLLYELELFEDIREPITERGHFTNILALLDRYFKGALNSDTSEAQTDQARAERYRRPYDLFRREPQVKTCP